MEQHRFSIVGRTVSVRGAPGRVMAETVRFFQLQDDAGVSADTDVIIEVKDLVQAEWRESLPQWFVSGRDGADVEMPGRLRIAYSPDGDEFVLCAADEGSLGFVVGTQRSARIEFIIIRTEPHLGSTLSPTILFAPVLSRWAEDSGLIQLHASAACEKESGRALMCIASAGGGKTTAALSLVREGFQLLSDELIFVGGEHFSTCSGFMRMINVTRWTADQFPEVKTHCVKDEYNQRGKQYVDPQSVYGSGTFAARACPLAAILLLAPSQGAPAAVTVPPAAALPWLVQSVTFCEGQSLADTHGRLFSMLDNVPVFNLQMGGSVPALGRFLAEIAKGGLLERLL